MEAQPPVLGSSLLVPSVQELAKEPMITVPSRYIRSGQYPPIIPISNSSSVPTVPLVNHGVSSSLVEKLKLEIQEFFNLPMEEKKKLWQKPGEVEGFGQILVISENQKLDWGDMFYIATLPTHLRKDHLFPNIPLPFRETLDAYSSEMNKLAMSILLQMAKALKMKDTEMTKFFEDGMQSMRIGYYPPCPQPELVIGLAPHSDASGVTILLQVNEVEGLQIKKQGTWIPIKPLPNAFIVNIGDSLEIATNGTYRSIEHRVTVNSVKERLSIATFHSPKLEGEIGPAPSLISPNVPPLFSRIGVKEYFKRIFARELYGKSNLELMRIQNGKGHHETKTVP